MGASRRRRMIPAPRKTPTLNAPLNGLGGIALTGTFVGSVETVCGLGTTTRSIHFAASKPGVD
jgi:hypothetical protein